MDPAVLTILAVIIGGLISYVASFLSEWQRSKNEEKKHQRERETQILTERRDAYHEFIQVFSTKYSGESKEYLNAALDAAQFGNVVLPQPIKMEKEEINSLDKLIEVLIRLRTENRYNPNSYPLGPNPDDDTYTDEDIVVPRYDEWGGKFDRLRAEVALKFSPPLMEILLRET